MAIIIDGKQVSENIKTEIALSVKDLLDKGLRAPHLAVVIAGDDGAALSYVSSIEKQRRWIYILGLSPLCQHHGGGISGHNRFPEPRRGD